MSTKAVSALVAGDRLDLENDPYANGPCSAEIATGEPCDDRDEDGSTTWRFEVGIVESVEVETPECTLVEFTNGHAIGFPPAHQVTLEDA